MYTQSQLAKNSITQSTSTVSSRLSYLRQNRGNDNLSKNNIKLGMAALDEIYLVGKIVEVNFFTSRVLLISDINSKIFLLEQDKASLMNQKKAYEKDIATLTSEDSIKEKLKPEIKDALISVRSSLAIPVGFTDIDEQIRNLQLLNKIPSDQSLTIRPYHTDTKFNYAKILYTCFEKSRKSTQAFGLYTQR